MPHQTHTFPYQNSFRAFGFYIVIDFILFWLVNIVLINKLEQGTHSFHLGKKFKSFQIISVYIDKYLNFGRNAIWLENFYFSNFSTIYFFYSYKFSTFYSFPFSCSFLPPFQMQCHSFLSFFFFFFTFSSLSLSLPFIFPFFLSHNLSPSYHYLPRPLSLSLSLNQKTQNIHQQRKKRLKQILYSLLILPPRPPHQLLY